MHTCTRRAQKKKKKGLGRGGGVQVPGLVATVRARRHLPQPGCESSRQGKDQKYTRDSQVFRADGKAQVHGDVWLKGSNGKLKKTTTEQTFFTWKRDECETFDASVSRAGLAGRPSIIPLLLKHRNESVTPYHRGELQRNPFGQAWRAEGPPGGDDTSDCWLLSAWTDDLKALPKKLKTKLEQQ